MYVCCAHVVPVRPNMYTAPAPRRMLSGGPLIPRDDPALVVTADRERVAVGAERDADSRTGQPRLGLPALTYACCAQVVARECEDVDGSRRRRRVVRLVPIDARRSAVLADRSNRQGAPIVAERHRHSRIDRHRRSCRRWRPLRPCWRP